MNKQATIRMTRYGVPGEETITVYARECDCCFELCVEESTYSNYKHHYLPTKYVSLTLTREQARQLAEGLGVVASTEPNIAAD